MAIYMGIQYELNRAWIYDDKREIIGETNFVVDADWLIGIYKEQFTDKYDSFEEFIDWYEPEDEGAYVYKRAIKEGKLIEDLGEQFYDEV